VLVRLAYAANMPTPADLVKKLQNQPTSAAGGQAGSAASGGGVNAIGGGQVQATAQGGATAQHAAQVVALHPAVSDGADGHPLHAMPISFEKLIVLFEQQKEPQLAVLLKDYVRVVSFKSGAMELNITRQTPPDFLMRVKQCLKLWTGTDWTIVLANEGGAETVRSVEVARDKKRRDEALEEPIVKSLLASFPGAKLLAVRDSRDEADIVVGGGDMPTDPDADVGDDETSGFDF